ncbi:MAG: EAL domain-containing protein [Legionellaceae bacterium]|nr:EAL domain-containing protein [Legionellaceae bacterium]
MRRQEINYERVAIAAERIKQRGGEPSITDLCEELGLVSIDPKISELLEKWYHNQPDFQRSVHSPLYDNIHLKTSQILKKNENLEKSLAMLRATLESTADGIMIVNGEWKIIDWNQKFIEMWRIPSYLMEAGNEQACFQYIMDQVVDPSAITNDVETLYKNPEWQGELPELHFKDGRIFERYTQPQKVGDEIVGRVYSFRNVTQKRLAEDELRIRERAIAASSHGVVIIDVTKSNFPVIYHNLAFERITGYRNSEILGEDIFSFPGLHHELTTFKRMRLAIREEREDKVEFQSQRQNGESYWCEFSLSPVRDSFHKIRHYVCLFHDITERRIMEEQLIEQATHDFLTGLPNRVLLVDRVGQAIAQSKKHQGIFALMLLDLDRFKMTNDTLGHSMGDKLIQAVANRLLIATSDIDTVARLGGDEFVILLSEITGAEDAQQRASEILQWLEKPFQIEQHRIKITASIGISMYPHDGTDYETLVKNADLSMYHAKDSGRNMYRMFHPEMNRLLISQMQLDSSLREALKQNEFHLVYQPLIDLRQKKVVGVEALIRWQSKLLGNVPPLDFIHLAEENGMILPIGEWVLEQACRQLSVWHQAGYKELTMAVNISGRQFRQPQLIEKIKQILQKTGLEPHYLELELTESLLVDNLQGAIDTMHAFKDMGIRLVIDDFGTGYSSLAYLKQFPVDKLKIDRSFINELNANNYDAAIARAIINLGHTLNLSVLAEGVETELQRNFISAHGCDYAQGYFFKAPAREEDISNYLAQNF